MPLAPAAIGIVFNGDKTQVLLVKRKDIPLWVLPGGGIESNETAEDAVVREVEEETGFQIKIERKCAEYTPVNKLGSFTTVFVCQIIRGKALLSTETSDIQFYSLNQLPTTLFRVHYDWLNDALTHSTCIQKPLKNVTYFEVLKFFFKHPIQLLHYMWTRFIKRS